MLMRMGIKKFFYFDIISEVLDHNAYFVNKALFKILSHSVFQTHQIKQLKIWCDNAKHFKNQELFFDFYKFSDEYGLKIEVNFLQKSMGKVIVTGDLE
jgi:hypothetical protein